MARRCDGRGVMGVLLQDPRMRLLPLAARALWLLLAEALAGMPSPGEFRIGGKPLGSAREVSMLVSCAGTDDETQIETHLQTLLETGLLRRLPDGALALPEPAPAAVRTRTAQENGRCGGRPRRGETAEEARLRRQQTSMLLPIGGARQTEAKPSTAPLPHARAQAAAEEKAELAALTREVAEAAGIATIALPDQRTVARWLERGATPEAIHAVVGAIASRPSYAPPRHLGYFTAAILERVEDEPPVTAPTAPTAEQAAATARYLRDNAAWLSGGRVGAPPVPPPHIQALGAAA